MTNQPTNQPQNMFVDKDKTYKIIEDAELLELVQLHQEVKKKIDEMSKVEEEMRAEIFNAVQNENTMIGNFKITYSQTPDKVKPDYEAYCKQNKIVPEITKVVKGRATRRISLIEKE